MPPAAAEGRLADDGVADRVAEVLASAAVETDVSVPGTIGIVLDRQLPRLGLVAERAITPTAARRAMPASSQSLTNLVFSERKP